MGHILTPKTNMNIDKPSCIHTNTIFKIKKKTTHPVPLDTEAKDTELFSQGKLSLPA